MCYCLDLRSDSKLAKFLSNKLIAVLIAVIQLMIWVVSIFALIAPPDSMKYELHTSTSGVIAFIVIMFLIGIAFSVLLILGILKGNHMFIQSFLVFLLVIIILFVVGLVYNLFTRPSLSGFFSGLFLILLDVLTYFIIRNYYLSISTRPNQPRNQAII